MSDEVYAPEATRNGDGRCGEVARRAAGRPRPATERRQQAPSRFAGRALAPLSGGGVPTMPPPPLVLPASVHTLKQGCGRRSCGAGAGSAQRGGQEVSLRGLLGSALVATCRTSMAVGSGCADRDATNPQNSQDHPKPEQPAPVVHGGPPERCGCRSLTDEAAFTHAVTICLEVRQ